MKNFTKQAITALIMLFALTTGAHALDLPLTNGQNWTTPLSNAGTLSVTVAADETATISGLISGTCNLVKIGNGTLILTGTNTFTGTVAISAGTLQIGNGGSAGTLGQNITGISINKSSVRGAEGKLEFNVSTDLTVPCPITTTGILGRYGGKR